MNITYLEASMICRIVHDLYQPANGGGHVALHRVKGDNLRVAIVTE